MPKVEEQSYRYASGIEVIDYLRFVLRRETLETAFNSTITLLIDQQSRRRNVTNRVTL